MAKAKWCHSKQILCCAYASEYRSCANCQNKCVNPQKTTNLYDAQLAKDLLGISEEDDEEKRTQKVRIRNERLNQQTGGD